ncbi:hypothetical protein [Marinicella sp. W31]|uniref:hypothetical protein n=1 Tax=Marinicella sp. W31 TaxID=3023713 RepID=UPI003757C763
MFTFLRSLSARRLLTEQGPVLAISWLIAEFFYKFHSFSLECGAFMATWFALDATTQIATSLLTKTGHNEAIDLPTSARKSS